MSIDSIRAAIEQRFIDNWTDTPLATGVRWSNRPFKPPATAWVSLDVRFTFSRNSTIGSTTIAVRRSGSIFVDIYTPVDSGTGSTTVSVDNLLAIFENVQFATADAGTTQIQCLAADIRHTGVPNIQGLDPMWYKYSVRVPFYRYE